MMNLHCPQELHLERFYKIKKIILKNNIKGLNIKKLYNNIGGANKLNNCKEIVRKI